MRQYALNITLVAGKSTAVEPAFDLKNLSLESLAPKEDYRMSNRKFFGYQD